MSFLKMFSFLSRQKEQRSLTELPFDFLVRLFQELDSVRDVVALQSTCKVLRDIGRCRPVWTNRFRKEYGLNLKADSSCKDGKLQKLYRDTISATAPLRFWGVLTDGGCDNEWFHYWMDNFFIPNHWNAFCSETGRNVNCVGVLVEGEMERDIRLQNDRNYMLHKCRIPASQIFNEPLDGGGQAMHRLQGWSHQDLMHFMVALYHDMEAGGIWGGFLLHGIPPDEIETEKVAYLREFVQKLERVVYVGDAGIVPMKDRREDDLDEENPIPCPLLYDTTFTDVARQQPDTELVGVFDSVTVSRQGAFSCPVLTGVLFVTQMDIKRHATSDTTMTNALEDLCQSDSCLAFDDLSDLAHIQAGIGQKRLPQARRFCTCSQGSWIEFDNACPDPKFRQLQPVVWFRFYEKEAHQGRYHEDHPLEEYDDELLISSDEGSNEGTIIFDDDDEIMDDLDLYPNPIFQDEDFSQLNTKKDMSRYLPYVQH